MAVGRTVKGAAGSVAQAMGGEGAIGRALVDHRDDIGQIEGVDLVAGLRLGELDPVFGLFVVPPPVPDAGDVHPAVGGEANRAVDHAGGLVVALEEELAFEGRCGAVGDIQDGQLGDEGDAPVPATITLAADQGAQGMLCGQVTDVDLREHHRALGVAVDQHLPRRTLELILGLGNQVTELGHAEDVQAIAVERVDVVAVGLDEVGFVDPGLLVVGAGVVGALFAPALVVASGGRAGVALETAVVAAIGDLVEVGLHLGDHHLLEIGL